MKAHILIIDDHQVVRDGIKLYLENDPEYEVAGEASSGPEGLEMLESQQVNLVLMDLSMKDLDGIETTKEIIRRFPAVKVVALTMHNDYQHIRAMMEAGASGYILKSCDEQELKQAIDAVMNDTVYYSREVANTVMNNMARKNARKNVSGIDTPLTPREKEVYRLILEELSNQEIADRLFISVRTVEVHKRNLLEKTGAKNTTGLVLFAIKNQLFDTI